jgi:putative endonuclease
MTETSRTDDADEHDTTVGDRGEAIAEAHLRDRGWTIHESNYETQRGEIDLVAETTTELGDREIALVVFVEVKTRSRSGPILPESAVTTDKRQTLTYMGQRYLSERDLGEVSSRFDVVTVQLEGDSPDIQHYESAFDALGHIN